MLNTLIRSVFLTSGIVAAMLLAVDGAFAQDAEAIHCVDSLDKLKLSLNEQGDRAKVIRLAPGPYPLSDPKGIAVPSNTTLLLHEATLVWDTKVAEDGQTFLLSDVVNVRIVGGSIVGQRDDWDPGTNVAGIRVLGKSRRLCFEDICFSDLTSNGIGVFGVDEKNPIIDVQVRSVVTERCCNYYGDYLATPKGPAEGSVREDQGGVAFYYVEKWVVSDSLFLKSLSDGTHFYQSHDGLFVDNQVRDSQMGGYFLEGCERVIASGNIVSGNGSRGVTIERDSRFCTLNDNVIEFSGREGLWAPDIAECVVASNIFRKNGRKDDGERDSEIRLDDGDSYEVQTDAILITDNLFQTDAHQNSVIHLEGTLGEIVIQGNLFTGETRGLAQKSTGVIHLKDNTGLVPDSSG